MVPKQILIELLKRATKERFGLLVETTNPPSLLHDLSIVRTEIGEEIMICTPSLPGTLFLVPRSMELS